MRDEIFRRVGIGAQNTSHKADIDTGLIHVLGGAKCRHGLDGIGHALRFRIATIAIDPLEQLCRALEMFHRLFLARLCQRQPRTSKNQRKNCNGDDAIHGTPLWRSPVSSMS